MYDSHDDTVKHISKVGDNIKSVIEKLHDRTIHHDASKLVEPEKSTFDKYTPLLKDSTYGSDEYKSFLIGMGVALKHHYENNRHHPEHFQNGINGMTLIDMIEMLCDWIAASERHANGDVYKSIDLNKERFGYSDEMATIFKNTVRQIRSR